MYMQFCNQPPVLPRSEIPEVEYTQPILPLMCQFPGNLADRSVSSSTVRDLSLLLYSVASRSHLSHIT